MSTSVLETAETLDPGHISLGINGGIGIDLASSVFFQEDTSNVYRDHLLTVYPVTDYKIGVGVADGYELTAKYWSSPYNYGLKFYLKKKLQPLGNSTLIAVLPGISLIIPKKYYSSSEDKYPNTSAYGIDLPFLVSHGFTKLFTMYSAGHYSVHSVQIKKNKAMEFQGTYVLNRLGFVTGISLEPSLFYFRLEIGIEGAKMINGGYGYYPIAGIGLGLKLKKPLFRIH